jgi:hypothetical protein
MAESLRYDLIQVIATMPTIIALPWMAGFEQADRKSLYLLCVAIERENCLT